jgi:hypothetical protein
MTRRIAAVAALVLAAVAWSAAPPRESRKPGLFAPLEAGQRVSLREKDHGYEIGVVPGAELDHKVLEVGADYVVLEDPAGVTETRIPLCSVKAIKVTRAPKGK